MRLFSLIALFAAALLFSGCIQLPSSGGAKGTVPPKAGTAPGADSAADGISAETGEGASGEAAAEDAAPSEPAGPQEPTGPAEQPDGPETAQVPATSLENREISYASGAWKIYGTLYDSKSKAPTKAVMLIPALGKTRDSYPVGFIESLHERLPDAVVIAIDLRGHGKSTNLGTYESFDMAAFKDMKSDIINARAFVQKEYPNVKEYYLVGASMGSTAAILAGAQEKAYTKLVMLSPGMEYRGVSIERAAEDYQFDIFAAASKDDAEGYSASSANTIRSLHSGTTEVKIYSGTAHGTDMFAATEGSDAPLSGAILEFLLK